MPAVGVPIPPSRRRSPVRPPQDVLSRMKGRVALPMARAMALSAGQQADRMRDGNVSDTYENAMNTEGGSGKGAIRTIPKSYTQSADSGEGEGILPTDLEQRQDVRAREEAMRESMASFSGVDREGLASFDDGSSDEEEGQGALMAREGRRGQEDLSDDVERRELDAMAALAAARQAAETDEEAQEGAVQQGQEQEAAAGKKQKEDKERLIAQFVQSEEVALGVVDGWDLFVAWFLATARMVNTHTFKSKWLPSTDIKEDAAISMFNIGLFMFCFIAVGFTAAIFMVVLAPPLITGYCISGLSNAASCAATAAGAVGTALSH